VYRDGDRRNTPPVLKGGVGVILVTVRCVECPADNGSYISVENCAKCPFHIKVNQRSRDLEVASVECGYTFKKLEVEPSKDKEYETKW
jgi:hypothetical protein